MYFNMWWIRIFVILLTCLTRNLCLSDINIWKFTTSSRHGTHHTRPKHLHLGLNNKPGITCDLDVLRKLEVNVHHDNRLKILPFGAIRKIRSLRLNIKPRSCRCKGELDSNRMGWTEPILLRLRRHHILILTSFWPPTL